MSDVRIVKVFLASSITELKDERLVLSTLGEDITNLFNHDNIFVRFIRCESIHAGNTGRDDQDVIDEKIRECDISAFICKSKVGEKTLHEYELARALQKERKHEIFVYCLPVSEEEKQESLTSFQERLKRDHVYWKECPSTGDLRFELSMGILNSLGITLDEKVHRVEAEAKSDYDLFQQYKDGQALQAQRERRLHQAIDDLREKIQPVLSDDTQPISARIVSTLGLYEKASRWAAASSYNKGKYADLLFDYAKFLYKYGMYNEAERIYLLRMPIVENLYGIEQEETAVSYNNIGSVYRAKGDYAKALEYYGKSLKIREKVFGKDHESTAVSYNNIGLVYKAQGDFTKALEYSRKALKIRKRVLGREHQDTATSYNNIGSVYKAQGNFPKALAYFRMAMKIDEKVLGTTHLDTAIDYNNIGSVYDNQGDFPKALKYYGKALDIKINTLGPEHPSIATSYNNIGSVYKDQGDYPKALKYHGDALDILKSVFGAEHPSIATSYNNIGSVYRIQRNYPKALENYGKAKEIDEKILGPDHPDTAIDYNNVGGVCFAQGDYPEALEYFKKALAVFKSKLGEDHSYTKAVQRWIDETIAAMGATE